MAKLPKNEWVGCPFRFAAAAIGDKWSILLLRDLFIHGYTRFSEFEKADEGISSNVLANRLESYVEHGILDKKKDPVDARQSIYLLTKKGKGLAPIVVEMIKWAKEWDSETQVPDDFLVELLVSAVPRKSDDGHEKN